MSTVHTRHTTTKPCWLGMVRYSWTGVGISQILGGLELSVAQCAGRKQEIGRYLPVIKRDGVLLARGQQGRCLSPSAWDCMWNSFITAHARSNQTNCPRAWLFRTLIEISSLWRQGDQSVCLFVSKHLLPVWQDTNCMSGYLDPTCTSRNRTPSFCLNCLYLNCVFLVPRLFLLTCI
jgi:hypothetical protein